MESGRESLTQRAQERGLCRIEVHFSGGRIAVAHDLDAAWCLVRSGAESASIWLVSPNDPGVGELLAEIRNAEPIHA